MEVFPYNQLEMATGSFGGQSFLGRGSHGCVYKGVLEGGKLVAVKKQRDAQDRGLANEIEILSELQSPWLVNLVGVSHHESKGSLMVIDFMANGTLHDVLHCSAKPATWPRRVHIALQTAKAIRDLHSASPPVIHRDIKSSNVLIDAKWNARLGDLGLALRVQNAKNRQFPAPAGTLGYLDPNYVTPCGLSTKNDVFSFGILLLEIISGRKPIDVEKRPPCIVDWAMPLIQQKQFKLLCDPRVGPPKSLSGLKKMALLGAACIGNDLQKRPSMHEVVKELKQVSRCIPMPLWSIISGFLSRGHSKQQRNRMVKEGYNKGLSRSTRVSHGPEISSRGLGFELFSSSSKRSTLKDLLGQADEFAEGRTCESRESLSRSLSLPVFGWGDRRVSVL
eukprot:TRINITY_DN40075_c0_g1_i1.p1 TRINITY_DN40075_c0_g1~~TRINITY_DN40075_c0_g1_i1.p1  ORF type:complete len:392 (+),score=75.03 TRINITY_DN40075_c0_g1_i1:145-1320(+)